MKNRLTFLTSYLGIWFIFFLGFKAVFLLYHLEQTKDLSLQLIAGVFLNGMRMDLSFSAYASAIPFLLISLSTVVNIKFIRPLIKYYTVGASAIITFLCVTDLELFKAWGFRLDTTPLMYLDTPNEMLASAGASPIGLLLLVFIAAISVFIWLMLKKVDVILRKTEKTSPIVLPLFLFITASLIIPIRGGLQLAPLNVSDAYFSDNSFANQAAINVPWNFFNALSRNAHDKTNPYIFMEESEARQLLETHLSRQDTSMTPLLNTQKPNVLLIMWESLTAKAVKSLGGLDGITPEFEQLTKEGILFTNFYASGDRSDKGIVSILSGYPAQPTQSIIKLPSKSSKLPVLSQDFEAEGYSTSFYYGGELAFANIKSYLVNGGFGNIVGKDSFDKKDWNSKWGAHDHVVFDRVLDDLRKTQEPFFTTIFTLSSHEPFEVPMATQIKGEDDESLFLNSLYYTDKSLGNFVRKLKEMPLYEETLIIIVADHGHRMPSSSKNHDKEKFHIPMLWLGGALATQDTVINVLSSQTDLAATLLQQLELPSGHYKWSQDIFSPGTDAFAQYVFNNGFGHITKNGVQTYDNVGNRFIDRNEKMEKEETEFSKAYMQLSFQDFLEK